MKISNLKFQIVGLLLFSILFIPVSLKAETASPQEATISKGLNITIQGVAVYEEYKHYISEIKKITGVADLIPSRISQGETILSGRFVSDPVMFKNDIQAFATDRFKLDFKESANEISVKLKKL